MRYLLPVFGTHIQFEWLPESGKLLVYREFSTVSFEIELGLELRGGRIYRLITASAPEEQFTCRSHEIGANCLTIAGYDRNSGLRLTCKISNTFEQDEEEHSCVPGLLFECRAERVRKEPDNVAGNLFFKVLPRRGEVDVESAMRLIVGYYVKGAAINPNFGEKTQNQYELVRVRDHILPTRGKVRGKAIKQPFFFQYGKDVDTMRFVWCMFDPIERYRIERHSVQYFYNYRFKSIYQVENYMVKREWELRKKRDNMLKYYHIPGGGKRLNEIVAYALNSLSGNMGYYLEDGFYKRVVPIMPQGEVYGAMQMQFYALPYYVFCWKEMLYDIVAQWQEFGIKKCINGREILAFPDQMGQGYEVAGHSRKPINVANSMYFILFFYAMYQIEKKEELLWANREFLHKVFSFILLDFRELQYIDLFVSLTKIDITEYLPFSVLTKLKMVLKIIRELVYLLNLQKKEPGYLARLQELENLLEEKMHIAFSKIPNEIPYYDISEMVNYQMMFRSEKIWKMELAVDYVRRGAKQQFCPFGKGICHLDAVSVVQYCPFSKTRRNLCVEQWILRDVLLTQVGEEHFGNLVDYEAWVAEEQTDASYPRPVLSAAVGYLYLYQKKNWRNR